uniref:Dual specificity protein phosphatase n=1 Tax=Terrapene triunguis TaxID=2587831 RepID=A0A674IML5_9SAUR
GAPLSIPQQPYPTGSQIKLEHVLDSCRMELNHVDEVWPNLYIEDILIAHDKEELRKLGITHVLNAAHSTWESKGDQAFYGQEIHYCGIAAEDSTNFNLSEHFYPASDTIHLCFSFSGKILVHCVVGKSRSATLVLAYLMIYHHFSLTDAVQRVIQYRAISPNRGFLKQLQDLDVELRDRTNLCELL